MLRDIRSICCPRHVYMVYKILCSYQQSLHGLQDPVMLADISGGPQDHMLLSDIPAWSKVACTFPRHVCIIYMNLCCYQTCLHVLQRRVLLPDMSAWSAGACAAIRHVCMVYNGVCCSQTFLLGLQEPVLLSDMSAWSTTVCAAPRHVCLVCRSL